jgi:hypothetical protein
LNAGFILWPIRKFSFKRFKYFSFSYLIASLFWNSFINLLKLKRKFWSYYFLQKLLHFKFIYMAVVNLRSQLFVFLMKQNPMKIWNVVIVHLGYKKYKNNMWWLYFIIHFVLCFELFCLQQRLYEKWISKWTAPLNSLLIKYILNDS